MTAPRPGPSGAAIEALKLCLRAALDRKDAVSGFVVAIRPYGTGSDSHRHLLGRGTNSTSRAYIVCKTREAQKGKVRIGPRLARAHDGDPTKVFPVRVPAAAVGPLDEVRPRLGLRSRNEMIHKAMAAFLINAGESDLAGHSGATCTADDADAE